MNLAKDKDNRIKIKDFLYTNTKSDLYFEVGEANIGNLIFSLLCKTRHPLFVVDRQKQRRVFVQSRVEVDQQGRQHGRHHQDNRCLRPGQRREAQQGRV